MPISITRYVDITSGVGAASTVGNRDLSGNIFTTNPLAPTNAMISFNSASEVGTYFGTSSEEYKRATQYFGWVSKNITAPQTLNFTFWNSVATAPLIYGLSGAQTLASWTSITTGSFTLTMGAFSHTFTNLDFSAAASLSDVAGVIQTIVQAYSAGGTLWTSATVTWDSTNQRFDLAGGATGTAAISVTAGVSNDVAGQLGWLSPLAIFSPGAGVATITAALTAAAAANNNFGSFCFTNTAALNLTQVEEAATWNAAQNVMFMYSVGVTAANASAWAAALGTTGGVSLTLDPLVASQYPDLLPMMILAATDYQRQNSTQNYMYQIFNISASVTSDAGANTYDPLSINYYGNTQTAGQVINFYQRGRMQGANTDPLDQNTYANEIWFKDALGAALVTLLLAQTKVPANLAGTAQITNTLQGVINQALFNGTISVGKILTTSQQLYISQATGDAGAWRQVQNIGYWFNVVIEQQLVEGRTEYVAVYTLIYSKDDVIRKIVGSDILI